MLHHQHPHPHISYHHPIAIQAGKQLLAKLIDQEHNDSLSEELIERWVQQTSKPDALHPIHFFSKQTNRPPEYYLQLTSRLTKTPIVDTNHCTPSRDEHYLTEGLPLTLLSKTPFGAVTLIHCLPYLEEFLDHSYLETYYGALKVNFALTTEKDYLHHLEKISNMGSAKTRNFTVEPDFTENPHRFDSAIVHLKKAQLLPQNYPTQSDRLTILTALKQHKPADESHGETEWYALTTPTPYIHLAPFHVENELVELLPVSIQNAYNIIPICVLQNRITIASQRSLSNTSLYEISQLLPEQSHLSVTLAVPHLIDKQRAINTINGNHADFAHDQDPIDSDDDHFIPEPDQINQDSHDIVKCVNNILNEAAQHNATDVHIAPDASRTRIRFRVADTLIPALTKAPLSWAPAIANRIRVMSHINTVPTPLPQDGRFSTTIFGEPYDVRVNCTSTCLGTDATIRLQNNNQSLKTLEDLKYPAFEKDIITRCTTQSDGLLIICGPMGSGKTTTIAAAIYALDRHRRKVVTAENPVEKRIPGVEQTEIVPEDKSDRSETSNGFKMFLRASLRRNTDVVVLGEIRDEETAWETIKHANTGQILVTTLHAPNAYNAPSRLINFDIKPHDVAHAIQGIVCQRLIPNLCPVCRVQDRRPITQSFLEAYNIPQDWISSSTPVFHVAPGCSSCHKSGEHERTLIAEGFFISDETIDIIENHKADPRLLRLEMIKQGSKPLYKQAIELALKGVISLDAATRVRPRGLIKSL